jgi:hypothetical protein
MHDTSRRRSVPLGRFVSAIEERIATMSAEELRGIVLAFAEAIEASERPAFLARFGATPTRPAEAIDALLTGLELLEEEAASTGEPAWDEYDEWHDRYGWSSDDELREPDWAPSLVELLRRVGTVFLSGDASVAAAAYERLFKVAEAAMENGWSLASDPAEDEVLNEAAVRYLRSIGEACERGERPTRLRQALLLLDSILTTGELSLAAVEGARVETPADRTLLLEDWLAALEPLVEDGRHVGDRAHRLQLQVVDSLEGSTGLARLARAGGQRAGQTFLAWFDASRRDGDAAMTEMAGEEGLRSLKHGRDRATLAERMAVVADSNGRLEQAVSSRVEAWNSEPSLKRLLMVVDGARRAGIETPTIAALCKSRARSGIPAPLRVALLVLGGKLDVAVKETRAAAAQPAAGSARAADHSRATGVLIPVLLTAGADASRHEAFRQSVLATLLASVDRLVDSAHFSSSSRRYLGVEEDEAAAVTHDLVLGELLLEALERLNVSAPRRRSLFEEGSRLAAEAVAGIVEAKARRAYSEAASIAVAHAETVAIADGTPAGDAVAAAAQARYPRHVAYRSELIAARERSPFLTSQGRRW